VSTEFGYHSNRGCQATIPPKTALFRPGIDCDVTTTVAMDTKFGTLQAGFVLRLLTKFGLPTCSGSDFTREKPPRSRGSTKIAIWPRFRANEKNHLHFRKATCPPRVCAKFQLSSTFPRAGTSLTSRKSLKNLPLWQAV